MSRAVYGRIRKMGPSKPVSLAEIIESGKRRRQEVEEERKKRKRTKK